MAWMTWSHQNIGISKMLYSKAYQEGPNVSAMHEGIHLAIEKPPLRSFHFYIAK